MNDLISRYVAIDVVHKWLSSVFGINSTDNSIGVFKRLRQLPSAQPEIVRCKDCKHFEYDHLYVIQGLPVIGHLVCNKWGDGCRTDENGYCFMAERREE